MQLTKAYEPKCPAIIKVLLILLRICSRSTRQLSPMHIAMSLYDISSHSTRYSWCIMDVLVFGWCCMALYDAVWCCMMLYDAV